MAQRPEKRVWAGQDLALQPIYGGCRPRGGSRTIDVQVDAVTDLQYIAAHAAQVGDRRSRKYSASPVDFSDRLDDARRTDRVPREIRVICNILYVYFILCTC